MSSNVHYLDLFKHRGSIVTWALHWGYEDAYAVWCLAKKFNRENSKSGKATGRIRSPYFSTFLARHMNCQRSTAEKRLQRAVGIGFLIEDCNESYMIVSSKAIYKAAIEHHEQKYEDNLTEFRSWLIFANDREYTLPFTAVIPSGKLITIRAAMYGLMAVYGSRHLMSRETHAKLLRCSRNTTIRLAHSAGVEELNNYILIDVMSLLYKPECGPVDAIRAFQEAESIYRFGNRKTRGRKLFHSKTVKELEKTFLTIQLPNSYTNKLVVREVSLGQERSWLSSSDRSGGGFNDDRTPAKKAMSDGGHNLCNSKDLGSIAIPERIVQSHLHVLVEMLEVEECRSHILSASGAQNISPVGVTSPIVWRSKGFVRSATPSFLKKRSDQARANCSSLL